MFFYLPYGILVWIFTAGVVHTLSLVLGGVGTFISTLNIVGIMVFTPFVFIDTVDALYIILNAGVWDIVFNSITRIMYVLWSGVLLVFGLNVLHRLSVLKSAIIALVVIPLWSLST